jgi:bleomycin hydrolase
MKTYLTLAFVWLASISIAQDDEIQTITNAKGSNYNFAALAHLDATPVQSQGNTGTCWSFSSLSFFESEMIRMGTADPDILSEMFIVRKAYEAKADHYVRMNGRANFSEGGQFHDIPYVIRQYGIVPLEVYSGLNYGSEKHNHSEMFSVLDGAIQGLIKGMKSSKSGTITTAWKSAVNGILDAYLGEDIAEFEYESKKYTPQSYAKSIGLDMDDYLSLTSFTNHPMNKPCILAIQDNWTNESSYNVELNEMVEATKYAIDQGYTVAWDADVSEKRFSFKNGITINPEDESTLRGKDGKPAAAFMIPVAAKEVTAESRQEGYDNKSTEDDHLMHIVGLYEDQKGTAYFLVKNSWGTGNLPEGYLYVSESYFKEKTILVYLNKGGLSKDMTKSLGLN